MNYGKHGTTYLLKPNLLRHISSEAHKKCLEIETGVPACKKQKTISDAFCDARDRAKKALIPLLHASVYMGRKEKPYSQFSDFLETTQDMGLSLTSAFHNDKAAKAFNHIVAQQMIDEVRDRASKGNFNSFLIDGSAAAKRRLTYEAELIYVRTACELKPKTELFAFVPMESYAVVNSEHLLHALLKELSQLGDKNFVNDDKYVKPVDEVSIDSLAVAFKSHQFHRKVIGAGADGASINFGNKKGLLQLYKKKNWC